MLSTLRSLGIFGALLTTAFPLAAEEGAAAKSEFVPQGYELVFSDEFNAPKLDISKWWTRYIYDGGLLDTLNDERQRFREDGNHVLTGTSLNLTAHIDPNLSPKPRFKYRSGMVRSKVTFKYGYFEMRAKMPRGRGCWPAFWLNSDKRESDGKLGWPPEIDILEFVNNEKDDKPNMIHVGMVMKAPKDKKNADIWGGELLEANPKMKGGHYHSDFLFPADFHVFSCLWDTDDVVTIYCDGVLLMKRKYKWVYPDATEAGYAHVLMNLSIGGQWAGRHGIDDSAFPQAMEIDYVRVYQKPDAKRLGVGTIGQDLLQQ